MNEIRAHNNILAQGFLGMMIAGYGAMDMARGSQRNWLVGAATALGSAAFLTSFYRTHKFKKEDGQYNYANIAMVAFVAMSTIGLNIVYLMNPNAPVPDFCETHPASRMCQPGQSTKLNFGKTTGS